MRPKTTVMSGMCCAYLVALTSASLAMAQEPGEWPHFGRDLAGTRYSPLDQIDAGNVNNLEIAWRWTSPDAVTAPDIRAGHFKATPLMVDGVLYLSTALSQVAAVDAATGETIWRYDPKAYEKGRPANTGFQHRGVAWWADGDDRRILIATGTRELIAIDAGTGKPVEDFGEHGRVDLVPGLGGEFNPAPLGYNTPPVIVRDKIVLGSIISDGPTSPRGMPPGHIRGFDVRTGEQKWLFRTVPQPGEYGNDTWLEGSWEYTGNTNAWGPLTADEKLGYVYIPVGAPTSDYFGGHRPGDNLFSQSLLCLDAESGERVWHFQAVHHGIWDYDFCAAPNLLDITVDGETIPAVAEVSKQGFTYVFHRETGEPVWPIEERPVEQTPIAAEWTSPTQPFPTRPPAFERQGVQEHDLNDLTPELFEEAKRIMKQFVSGPLFTPPTLHGVDGRQGTLCMPGGGGGANWAGAAVDPETGMLYVHSNTIPRVLAIAKGDPARTPFSHIRVEPAYVTGPQGLPLVKPPWGRITAIDLNAGEIRWQVPHGYGPRNHPAIAHLDLGPLGAPGHREISSGGPLLTKTLLFYTQAERNEALDMTEDGYYIRAFDKQTGEKRWERNLDLPPHGPPMTYAVNGKQYIVFAAGGADKPAQLIALALP